MFDDEQPRHTDQEVLSCTEIAEKCRHNPLFDMSDELSGECLGTEQSLSEILEMVSDESDEDSIDGFRKLIATDVGEEVIFNGLELVRVA